MEKEKAKEFLFDDQSGDKIYISKDLQTLLNMNDGQLFFIYAVLETENGDVLMLMDWSYAGEPIIMHRFIHKNYFIRFTHKKVINL